jgi:hypothetical protein
MPFSKAIQLFEYWAYEPPIHVTVARYLGYKKKPKVDALEMGKTMQALAPTSRGKAKSKDRAPLHIQQLIEDSKKKGKRRG